jgi:hypothetical protein
VSDHRIRRQGRIAAVLDVKVEPPIHQGLALTHNLFLNSGHSDLSKNFRTILAFKISESIEPMPESIQARLVSAPKCQANKESQTFCTHLLLQCLALTFTRQDTITFKYHPHFEGHCASKAKYCTCECQLFLSKVSLAELLP